MDAMEQTRKDLPNSTAVLVLGILSLVFIFCYGIIGLTLGIIAVALSGTPRRIYQADPEAYTVSSVKNLNAGRVCGIIGICLSIAFILIIVLLICGVLVAGIGAASLGL